MEAMGDVDAGYRPKTSRNEKGPPGRPDGPFLHRGNDPDDDYIAFDVLVIMVSFDIIMSLPMVSLAIMPPFMAPSTAVMLSVVVSMPSVAFMSVTMLASVVFSVFEPQAETASAAPAMTEPIRTLEMIARIGSSLDI